MNDPTSTSECRSHGVSRSTMTFAFLAGGIAGAAVALLLAPGSGERTRGIMGRKLNGAADSARELRDRAIRRGRELGKEAAHRVEGAASALAGKGGQGNGDLEHDVSPA